MHAYGCLCACECSYFPYSHAHISARVCCDLFECSCSCVHLQHGCHQDLIQPHIMLTHIPHTHVRMHKHNWGKYRESIRRHENTQRVMSFALISFTIQVLWGLMEFKARPGMRAKREHRAQRARPGIRDRMEDAASPVLWGEMC